MATDKDNRIPIFRGHAVLWDDVTTLMRGKRAELREVFRRGAFSKALAEKQDIRLLYNHSWNHLLARTASGTLTVSEDNRGLYVEAELAETMFNYDRIYIPNTRKDLNQMSFAFYPDKVNTTFFREGGKLVQLDEILSVSKLEDVSPVSNPAYPNTRFEIVFRSKGERAKDHAKRFSEWVDHLTLKDFYDNLEYTS